jgi:transposase
MGVIGLTPERFMYIIIFTVTEGKMADSEKNQLLKKQGVFNRHARKIKDPLFQSNSFFDPCDIVQAKYEMVRQVMSEGKSISETASAFGMSRPTFYQSKNALEKEGLIGLSPKKTGPKRRHKISFEVMAFISEKMDEDETLTWGQLAAMVSERFAVTIHPRSIERAVTGQKKITGSK